MKTDETNICILYGEEPVAQIPALQVSSSPEALPASSLTVGGRSAHASVGCIPPQTLAAHKLCPKPHPQGLGAGAKARTRTCPLSGALCAQDIRFLQKWVPEANSEWPRKSGPLALRRAGRRFCGFCTRFVTRAWCTGSGLCAQRGLERPTALCCLESPICMQRSNALLVSRPTEVCAGQVMGKPRGFLWPGPSGGIPDTDR